MSGKKKRSISSRPMRKANNARSLKVKCLTICASLGHSTDTQSSRLKSPKSSTRRPSQFYWNIRAESSSSRCVQFSRPAMTCEKISWSKLCSLYSTRFGRTLAWRRSLTSINTWLFLRVPTLVSYLLWCRSRDLNNIIWVGYGLLIILF